MHDAHATPAWVADLLSQAQGPQTDAALMALAIRLAGQSAGHGGGPFGAVVADPAGNLVAVGWNAVVPLQDSTAHAEILALRRAQRALGTHDLAPRGLRLFTSCAPCIQCFGAIWWSGLRHVVSGATREDAEAIGFSEGPVTEDLWRRAAAERGIRHVAGFAREAAVAPLKAYQAAGRPTY